MSAIKIIATPPGEAPQEVREAWVGLVLPLAAPGIHKSKGFGVLSVPKTMLGVRLRLWTKRFNTNFGYVVDSAKAVEILARSHPQAADWWRQNVPHGIKPGQRFIFATHACEEVPEVVWPPPPVGAPSPKNKPPTKFIPLWQVVLASGSASLLVSGFFAWHYWHEHRPIEWGNVVFQGLWIFSLNVGVQLWVRWQVRKSQSKR